MNKASTTSTGSNANSQATQTPPSDTSKEEMLAKLRELKGQGKLPSLEDYLKAWDEVSAEFRPKILRLRQEEAKGQVK